MIVDKLVEFQRELVTEYKEMARRSHDNGAELEQYFLDQKNYTLDWEEVDFKELLRAALCSELISLGDVHGYGDSGKLLLELMNGVKKVGPVEIGLEAVLEGEEFRLKDVPSQAVLKTKMLDSFQGDAKDYRRFINEVTQRGMAVYGISREGEGLVNRDQSGGEIIGDRLKNRPGKQAVFIGEAHLCPDHLPAEIDSDKQMVVLQNLENIYFGLGEERIHGEPVIVKLTDSVKGIKRFCVINGPPAEKHFALYYEGELAEEREEVLVEGVERIRGFVEGLFGLSSNNWEGNYSFAVNGGLGKRHKREVKDSLDLKASSSWSVPTGTYDNVAYLAKAKLAHMAQVTGGMIYDNLGSGDEVKKETWSHLCSFLVNPYRYFDGVEELEARVDEGKDNFETHVAEGVLDYLDSGELPTEERMVQKMIAYRVGQIKGREIYDGLISGSVGVEEVKSLFLRE